MRTLLLCLLLTGLVWAQDLSRPEGRWEVAHTDGKIFHIDVQIDHSCTSDYGGGEVGSWRYEPGVGLTLDWTDGWRDRIFTTPEGELVKWGWKPGADRNGEPSNRTRARKLR